jgi:hypothetical protein
MVTVIVAAADDVGTHPCGHSPTSTLPHVSCRCSRRRRGGDPSFLLSFVVELPRNNYDDAKDAAIASTRKNNDDPNIVIFTMVAVVVTAAGNGGTHLCGHLLTSTMPCISCHCARRRRGRDTFQSMLWSNNDEEDASGSKNNNDHDIHFFKTVVVVVMAADKNRVAVAT